MPEVRLLADEVFGLHARGLHARLDYVVFGLELVAVGAVALFEPPGGAVHADSTGGKAERTACLPQHVPELQSLVDGDVELPAQVAHIRDA